VRERKKCEAQINRKETREALEASKEIDIYALGLDGLG
jgi:hypothetical protein